MNNAIYLRRRNKICLPVPTGRELLPISMIGAMAKNFEGLGYGLSPALVDAIRQLRIDQLMTVYQEVVGILEAARGAHRAFKPMYPNFPSQVMETSRAELYVNAMLHYWTDGRYLPDTEIKERFPLLDNVTLTMIDLGDEDDFRSLFGQIAASNASLSVQDKEDLTWFIVTYGAGCAALLPEVIPQKETIAVVAALLAGTGADMTDVLSRYCRTATDVLRLAVAMSGGDVSLAKATKFRGFTRGERRLLLGLLERMSAITEDMLRWKGRWIRLGERLHPGEFASRYPKANEAFGVLRNDLPFATFNDAVEKALRTRDLDKAAAALASRPGDMARRLDHLLRLNSDCADSILQSFGSVAGQVSTPVLLQLRSHFRSRAAHEQGDTLRVFFPKGDVAKVQAIPNRLPELPAEVCDRVVDLCTQALLARFAERPPLGKCFVDPELANYMAPFSQRSASKSLRTLARGSRLPIPDGDTLRFFIWWKNGDDRTDIDLSAAMLDKDFNYVDILSYMNLKSYGAHHSGDIVDAPEGASEFIDITRGKTLERGVRYIVMCVNSFSQQPFVELPECFAGWMSRQHPNSGEIFEARTVQDRLDLTADTRIAIPVVFDLVEGRAIWTDLAMRSHPHWQNNVQGNAVGTQFALRSIVSMRKTDLHDLLSLHVQARGEAVENEAGAKTVFSVGSGTPFQLETIASEFMA